MRKLIEKFIWGEEGDWSREGVVGGCAKNLQVWGAGQLWMPVQVREQGQKQWWGMGGQ